MARSYGKRDRMLCGVCGKDCAISSTTGAPRQHKCPHGVTCGSLRGFDDACPACAAAPKPSGISANSRANDRMREGGGW